MRTILESKPLEGYPTEIAVWLWAMQEAREKTKAYVKGISQDIVDWAGPDGNENSIGTLLYHIAAVEMGWLHFDVLERADLYPEDELPLDPFTEGRLTPFLSVSLEDHLARLDKCRAIFLERMKDMTVEDWSKLRSPEGEDYSVSPAWAVFHLVEHEAGHAAQIGVMKKRARSALELSTGTKLPDIVPGGT
jgi:uncharacterized damage-inducible protein DinB